HFGLKLTKTMNCWRKLPLRLKRVGTYVSPMGGSRRPAAVTGNELLFEVILEGSVYGLEETPVLHGEGAVFCHRCGEMSVSNSPPGSYYHCFVVWFECGRKISPWDWPRCFQWKDRKSMHAFIEEMLHAFHYAALERDAIGSLIL